MATEGSVGASLLDQPLCTRLTGVAAPGKVVKAMNRDLRRRCETIVRTLDQRIGGIPVPFDLNAFLDQLETDRGRPIELAPFSATAPGKLCGIWIGTDRLDLIYHEEATSLLHQDHIILHEIGHMVCNHTGAALSGADQVRSLLLTDAVRGQVETVLGRGAYTAVEEQEAELVATLILERAIRPVPAARAVAPTTPEVTAAQQRIEAIWGRRPTRPWS
ncbi:MAG: hypothetical protein ACRDQU_03180 [Pseudonocardiaceae bacterium]